jgi:Membrane proteins related to metalloendopeptidases
VPENPVDSDVPFRVDPGQATPISGSADAAVEARPLTRRELRERERAAQAAAEAARFLAADVPVVEFAVPDAPVAPAPVSDAPPADAPAADAPIAETPVAETPVVRVVDPETPAPVTSAAATSGLDVHALNVRALDAPTADAPATRRVQTHRMPPLTLGAPRGATAARRRKGAWLAKGANLVAMTFAIGMAIATSIPSTALVSRDSLLAQAAAAEPTTVAKADPQSVTTGGDVKAEAVTRDVYEVKSLDQIVALSHMRIADTFTNDPNGTIQWPFPVGVPITDWFGPRVAPTDGASTFHEGIDFTPGAGTPIQIIADGVVREVVTDPGDACGVHVIIDHLIKGQLISSEYCHMQAGSVRVAQGQHVKVADIVGLVGNTGISTGAHLHFQIMLGGTTPVDPFAWLKANAN